VKKFKIIFFSLFIVFSCANAYTKAKVIPLKEAFVVSSEQKETGIALKIHLAQGIYLYDEHLHVSLISPLKQNLDGEIEKPKSQVYEEFRVFFENVSLFVPTKIIKKYVKNGEYKLVLEYQGCSKSGICYPPQKEEFTYRLSKVSNQKEIPSKELSEQDSIANSFKTGSVSFIILSFFGFGLLLSLTPCIFPMIPILSSIIVSQGDKMTTKKSFILSLVYVLAMSIAYTIAGVLAGLFGSNLQVAFQNPWVISAFSLIFVALSLSMFGFYNIQLPSFLQSAITKKSDQMQGHGILGVAIMGFLSALIVGPCVAAPLAGALIYIGQSGDAFLGGAALFFMSLGMGLPLILIGVSAGKFMPRPGVWMDNVKVIFGVILLGVAIWMLSRIVPMNITMLLSAILIISSAIYMGALEPLKEPKSGWMKLLKSLAIIFFIYGVILFVGVFSGSRNFFYPLEKTFMATSTQINKEELDFIKVSDLNDLQKRINDANQPVMVDFYADWCVNCKELEQFTFSDKRVQERLKSFLLLKVDVTKNSQIDKAMMKHFGIFGPPALLFFQGKEEIKNLRIVGFKSADEFLKHIKSL